MESSIREGDETTATQLQAKLATHCCYVLLTAIRCKFLCRSLYSLYAYSSPYMHFCKILWGWFGLLLFPFLSAAVLLVTIKLYTEFIAPYDIIKIIIKFSTSPLKLFLFVFISYQLTIC